MNPLRHFLEAHPKYNPDQTTRADDLRQAQNELRRCSRCADGVSTNQARLPKQEGPWDDAACIDELVQNMDDHVRLM
ncbi:unnamed protein product, partial [Amoebophrya sp. A120]|eukprot:GSA120T00023214001.1